MIHSWLWGWSLYNTDCYLVGLFCVVLFLLFKKKFSSDTYIVYGYELSCISTVAYNDTFRCCCNWWCETAVNLIIVFVFAVTVTFDRAVCWWDMWKCCRVAWQSLGSMSQEDAMSEFVSFLRKSCPLFAPYVQAHVAERQERERKQWVNCSLWSLLYSFCCSLNTFLGRLFWVDLI